MALYIKDPALAELARDLARRRRCTLTSLVRQALERERDRLEADEARRDAELRTIQERFRRDCPDGSSDHGFLYDEQGSPVL